MQCIMASPGEFYPEVVAIAPLVRLQQLLLRQAGEGRERHAVDLRGSTAKREVNSTLPNSIGRERRLFTLQSHPSPPGCSGNDRRLKQLRELSRMKEGGEAAGRPAIISVTSCLILLGSFTAFGTLIGIETVSDLYSDKEAPVRKIPGPRDVS